MGPFGFGGGTRRAARASSGVPQPPAAPTGFIFLTDTDGVLLSDADGANLMEPA
jgi:hypothetical protein